MSPSLTLAQHLTNNVLVLAALGAVDHGLIKPFVARHDTKLRSQRLTRWFFVHALANAFVVLGAFTSLRVVLRDPAHSMDSTKYTDQTFFGDASVWPLTIINSVHVYHMIGGFGLTAADYFHHLLFVPALGFPGQVYHWGALANWQAFYISGLPGGLDYFMLGLIRVGYLSSMFEKRVNANMNTWIRAPGILATTTLVYVHYIAGNHSLPFWCIFLQLILPGYNVSHSPAHAPPPAPRTSPARPAHARPVAALLVPRRCTLASRRLPTTPSTTCSTCSGRTSLSRRTSSSAPR
jgi:hypothetical protein